MTYVIIALRRGAPLLSLVLANILPHRLANLMMMMMMMVVVVVVMMVMMIMMMVTIFFFFFGLRMS